VTACAHQHDTACDRSLPSRADGRPKKKRRPGGKLTVEEMKARLRSRGDRLSGDATALRVRLALALPESVSARRRAEPPRYVPNTGSVSFAILVGLDIAELTEFSEVRARPRLQPPRATAGTYGLTFVDSVL
jgi:hypothetical protein